MHRISFELSKEKLKLLNKLTDDLGYEDLSETLNASLTLMRWANKKTSEGHSIGALSKDEFVKIILDLEHSCKDNSFIYGSDTVLDFVKCSVCGKTWEQYSQ